MKLLVIALFSVLLTACASQKDIRPPTALESHKQVVPDRQHTHAHGTLGDAKKKVRHCPAK